jgi:hypothetical protein
VKRAGTATLQPSNGKILPPFTNRFPCVRGADTLIMLQTSILGTPCRALRMQLRHSPGFRWHPYPVSGLFYILNFSLLRHRYR